jgi:hypothetical protein
MSNSERETKKNGYIKGTASERERKNPEDLSLTT